VSRSTFNDTIGKVALRILLDGDSWQPDETCRRNFTFASGQVGSMSVEKIIAAIETAARRERLVTKEYPEDHALWHAIFEALHGVGRGQVALGAVLRTAGLRFSIVRGPRFIDDPIEGEWIAVGLYGQIGGPIKGNEHECVGLGIFHLGH
jgi:hut operon positive regulator